MSVLKNEFIIKFCQQNKIDLDEQRLYISEFKYHINNIENSSLIYDDGVKITSNQSTINCGLKYLEKDYFNYEISIKDLDINLNPSKHDLISFFIENPNKGFYLTGGNGVGKTSLVVGLANFHYSKKNQKTLFVFWPDFIEKTKRFSKDNINYINKVKYCTRLIIDDLGQESITSWSRDDILSSMITYRLEKGLYTVITSNYNLNELNQLYALRNIESKKVVALTNKINALATEKKIIGKDYRV